MTQAGTELSFVARITFLGFPSEMCGAPVNLLHHKRPCHWCSGLEIKRGGPMAVSEASIPAVLRDWARQQPDAPAYTYIDYEIDQAGYEQNADLVRALRPRAGAGRRDLDHRSPRRSCRHPRAAGPGLRRGVLRGAGGRPVAVPLPVPQFGAHDERASAALQDCAPTVLLTTSVVVDDVVGCTRSLPGKPPAVIEVDSLDLDAEPNYSAPAAPRTKNAVLQYTSGSTRSPAAVVVTHKNILANIEQVRRTTSRPRGRSPRRTPRWCPGCPSTTTWACCSASPAR